MLKNKGYIALMSILIISFVLLSVSVTTSFESLNSLAGYLNREFKEISLNLALSCLDQAVVRLIQSPSYKPSPEGDNIIIGKLSCLILDLERDGVNITIDTKARSGGSITRLKAVFDEENKEIISLEEF